MLRGIYVYKCNQCGHKFIGADIEDRATVHSMPVHCSRCGSTNTEKGLMDTARYFWKLFRGTPKL